MSRTDDGLQWLESKIADGLFLDFIWSQDSFLTSSLRYHIAIIRARRKKPTEKQTTVVEYRVSAISSLYFSGGRVILCKIVSCCNRLSQAPSSHMVVSKQAHVVFAFN